MTAVATRNNGIASATASYPVTEDRSQMSVVLSENDRMVRIPAGVFALMCLLVLAACVRGRSGHEEAFCGAVRDDVPALLQADGWRDLGTDERIVLADMTTLVPEALVDDIEVLATSSDGGELRRGFAAVHAYADATCDTAD